MANLKWLKPPMIQRCVELSLPRLLIPSGMEIWLKFYPWKPCLFLSGRDAYLKKKQDLWEWETPLSGRRLVRNRLNTMPPVLAR